MVLPQNHLLWYALPVVRERWLPHVGDLEGPELLGARVVRVPLAADVLAEVEALVGELIVVKVLQILAPVLVLVEVPGVRRLLPCQLVQAEISAGDGQQVDLPTIPQVSGDDVPQVAFGWSRGEHSPVLFEPEESAEGYDALRHRDGGDPPEIPEEDI